jgi:polyhydroxyalkanoate synthesis repressor PhaR
MHTIKRYANRKHYDPVAKHYITLPQIAVLVRAQQDFQVVHHVTGEDLTSQTLAQIIFEEAKRGTSNLPVEDLVKIIREGVI